MLLWFIIIAAVLLLVLGGLYNFVRRDNPRQEEVDAIKEQEAEQILLDQPVDFQSGFRKPRDPYG
jgi:sensor domain CHASE-containing protein